MNYSLSLYTFENIPLEYTFGKGIAKYCFDIVSVLLQYYLNFAPVLLKFCSTFLKSGFKTHVSFLLYTINNSPNDKLVYNCYYSIERNNMFLLVY